MPGPAANSNSRNHSQLRIIDDRDSVAVHVRHINLATVRRYGDASWAAPGGNVLDQSLGGSVDGRNRVAEKVSGENAISPRGYGKPARSGKCYDIRHQIGRCVDHAHLIGRVIRHVNEATIGGRKGIFGSPSVDGHVADEGICRCIDHGDISRALVHHEHASTIRSDGELLWTSM